MPNAHSSLAKTILITGAKGFVSKALCKTLGKQAYIVHESARNIDKA